MPKNLCWKLFEGKKLAEGNTYFWEEKEKEWVRVSFEVSTSGVMSIHNGNKLSDKYLCNYDLKNITFGEHVPVRFNYPDHSAKGCTLQTLVCIPERLEMGPRIEPLYFNMTNMETMRVLINILLNLFKPPGGLPIETIEFKSAACAKSNKTTIQNNEPNCWNKSEVFLN